MNILNFLMILSVLIFVMAVWAIVSFRSLKEMKKRVDQEWYSLVLSLRKRQDVLPNLIETVRTYTDKQEQMLEEIIDLRAKAARFNELNGDKVVLEHDLSKMINRVIDFGKTMRELSMDTNFLELRKEINDLEKNIENHSKRYNEIVRGYNFEKRKINLKLWARVFGFKELHIFEMEI